MLGGRILRLSCCLLALAASLPAPVVAQDAETLPPYKMLRSLQFVQDSVVLGDHSASEMQRFMLETIDKRLRTADSTVFDDVRNVDAALIYAMSGGNPETLEYLVARDVNGNFDSRVSDALRKYLGGKGTLIAKSLAAMVPEYRDTKIAPYLALVAGNVTITQDPAAALKFYDLARLTAPGTIVEEAALRRSISVATDAKMVDKAFSYATRYARRFLHSPYASQFADLFVKLSVDYYEQLNRDDLLATLDLLDADRRREIYLRIARQAAIVGKNDLARSAAVEAKKLSGQESDPLGALADLYGGLADLPTSEVGAVVERISQIPDSMLTESDRVLKSAAEAVGREVLRAPDPDSFTQAETLITIPGDGETKATDGGEQAAAEPPAAEPVQTADGATPPQDDPEFTSFVEKGRSKLDEIDSLLDQESVVP
ncbi:chemotaxis protein [Ciceribacter sp. L1K23]|uniref:chemotaxis protein MotC n=1 Tax=unclassified Ciceribacter TaxID=2628820 RepID=UPI001ABDC538|nr:chemotaxis protein [Ciceribacter sp. L1K22]MBR0556992.1 chemotaxis protein [Ciceribacter sp. L1K23]